MYEYVAQAFLRWPIAWQVPFAAFTILIASLCLCVLAWSVVAILEDLLYFLLISLRGWPPAPVITPVQPTVTPDAPDIPQERNGHVEPVALPKVPEEPIPACPQPSRARPAAWPAVSALGVQLPLLQPQTAPEADRKEPGRRRNKKTVIAKDHSTIRLHSPRGDCFEVAFLPGDTRHDLISRLDGQLTNESQSVVAALYQQLGTECEKLNVPA